MKIYEIDINRDYYIDDELNVYSNQQDFINGKLDKVSGKEAIAILHQDVIEMREYYKARYFEKIEDRSFPEIIGGFDDAVDKLFKRGE